MQLRFLPYRDAHLLASYRAWGTGVGPSSMTLVTLPITAEGLSTNTLTRPSRSARVVPVIGARGWVAIAVAVNALTCSSPRIRSGEWQARG